jgi:hypothetical protein
MFLPRKFFTVVVLFNAIGIVLAATGVWNYPRNYTSALVLGNLLTAILMRNELFGRFLYLFVNTLFAKVSSILEFEVFDILTSINSGHR